MPINISHICCDCLEDTRGLSICPYCNTPLNYRHSHYKVSPLPPRTLLNNNSIFVGKCLGIGGFGITYLGLDITLNRKVVIKEFLPYSVGRHGQAIVERNPQDKISVIVDTDYRLSFQQQLERFLQEARIIAELSVTPHPNIVQIISYFTQNNTAYFIMPYKSGRTLEEYMHKELEQITEDRVLIIILQIANGLRFLHKRNIFHRDIKPSNIFLPHNDEALLIDFGTARKSDNSGILQNPTTFITSGYSPPEQYIKAEQSSYTDIYALAATLYDCLRKLAQDKSLKPLPPATIYLETGSVDDEQRQKYNQHIKPLINKVSQRFSTVLTNSLQPNPLDRPQSIDEFKSLLLKDLPTPVTTAEYYGLFMVEGEYKGEIIELPKTALLLGRDSRRCNLVFSQKLISRVHCKLSIQNNKLYLKNFHPTHSTYVNDRKLKNSEKKQLLINDQINLSGCQVLQVISTKEKTLKPEDLETTKTLTTIDDVTQTTLQRTYQIKGLVTKLIWDILFEIILKYILYLLRIKK